MLDNSLVWNDPDVARKLAHLGGFKETAVQEALSCQGLCGHRSCTLISAEVMRLDPERALAAGVVLGPADVDAATSAPICCHIE